MLDWLRRLLNTPPAAARLSTGMFDNDERLMPRPRRTLGELINLATPRKAGQFTRLPPGVAMDSATENNTVVAMDEGDFIKPFAFGMQDSVPPALFEWFANQYFIGYQMCALLEQHWFIKKACRVPAEDAMRHGYELIVDDGTQVPDGLLDKIKDIDEQFGVAQEAVNFIHRGKLFGIRLALFAVKSADPDYYEKPFNIDGVMPGSYEGIVQIDPYWITPELDASGAANPASKGFYEPEWWRIRGKRVHRTHMVIYRPYPVADFLKPTYFYGGVSLPQMLMQRVYASEKTSDEAPMMALSKRATVIHTNLEKAMADQQGFEQKMGVWSAWRDNWGVKVVGEEEQIEQFDTALAEFDALIMTQWQIACAIADAPAVKLMQTSPKGFNATGEFEMDSYHGSLQTMQSTVLSPFLKRHHQMLMKSLFPTMNFQLRHKWNPVDTPDAKEVAETNLLKAQAGAALVTSGAIDGYDERQRIINEDDSGYTGIPNIVPGGPGDRAAEQQQEQQMLQGLNSGGNDNPQKPKPGQDD